MHPFSLLIIFPPSVCKLNHICSRTFLILIVSHVPVVVMALNLCLPLHFLPPSDSKLNHACCNTFLTLIVPHVSLPCVVLLLVIVMAQLYKLSLCSLLILPPAACKLNRACSSTFLTLIVPHMSLPCVVLLLVIVMAQLLYTLSLLPLHVLPPSACKLNHTCSSTFLTLVVSHVHIALFTFVRR